MGPTLPLRVLTATLADRVAALVNTRQATSPNKYDQQVKRTYLIEILIICLDSL
jgi:hypothetical protein